jgi:hypothetical protein
METGTFKNLQVLCASLGTTTADARGVMPLKLCNNRHRREARRGYCGLSASLIPEGVSLTEICVFGIPKPLSLLGKSRRRIEQ